MVDLPVPHEPNTPIEIGNIEGVFNTLTTISEASE